jgi:hypothetical protein
MEERILYWDRDRLFGFEKVDRKNVEGFIEALRKNRELPIVYVGMIGRDYLLLPPDGGHHRALSHYLENRPLRIGVLKQNEIMPGTSSICFSLIDSIRSTREIFDIRRTELSLK